MELHIRGRLKPKDQLPVGGRFTARVPFIDDIHNRDVRMGVKTITAVRLGDSSGNATQLSLFAAEMLERNNPLTITYTRLHHLVTAGTTDEVRPRLREKKVNHRFDSNNYIKRLAGKVGEKTFVIKNILEAIRAICVYELIDHPHQFKDYFEEMVSRLYNHMLFPEAAADQDILTLSREGMESDPIAWFKYIYNDPKRGRWLGKLTPYQMDFFKEVLAGLAQIGTIDRFSRQVLEYKRSHKVKVKNIIRQVRQETGIPITPEAVELLFHLIYLSETR